MEPTHPHESRLKSAVAADVTQGSVEADLAKSISFCLGTHQNRIPLQRKVPFARPEVPVGRVAEVPVDDAQGPEFAMATAINLAASDLAV
jgi:hypothetical protein